MSTRVELGDDGDIGDAPFARALIEGRDRYNAMFTSARHHSPQLDAEAFARHLRGPVATTVRAVSSVDPAQAPMVTEIMYSVSLGLMSQGMIGPQGPSLAFSQGWSRLLPYLARHIATEPRRVIGSITNAMFNLARTPGARPDEWVDAMSRLANECGSVDDLLAAGQVAAWLAGMAQFRTSALDLCGRMAAAPLAIALDAPWIAAPSSDRALAIDRLRADPWLSTRDADHVPKDKALRIVRRVGSFRGFGGSFLAPPTIGFDGQFVVGDGKNAWVLSADRFGATLHALDSIDIPIRPHEGRSAFVLEPRGSVRFGGRTWFARELETWTSWACDGVTLAVTTALSHTVILLAFAGEGEPL